MACIPAGVIGILFDDWMEAHLHKPEIISAMLILYGILFIVVENWNKGKMPKVTNCRSYRIRQHCSSVDGRYFV